MKLELSMQECVWKSLPLGNSLYLKDLNYVELTSRSQKFYVKVRLQEIYAELLR